MRRARSFADLLLAALCLWAAWYHTPPGALLRGAFARLAGGRSVTPGLLSYYGAGARAYQLAEPLPPRAALSPGAALGLGAQSALERTSPADRAQVLARAGLRSGSADALGDWIGREAQRQGSREAAVLSLFCGEEAARAIVPEPRVAQPASRSWRASCRRATRKESSSPPPRSRSAPPTRWRGRCPNPRR